MAEPLEIVEEETPPTGKEVQPEDATGAGTPGEPEAEGAEPSGDEPTGEPAKSEVQKRIDTITRKRREAEERENYQRGRADAAETRLRVLETPEPVSEPIAPLSSEQFETDEEYQDARIKRAVREETGKVTRELQERDRQRIAAESAERRNTAIGPDLVAKAQEVGAFATDTMLDAAGDQVKKVVEVLVADPTESQRIGALPPVQQAVAIGEIRARLKAGPPQKKITSAPNPPAGVGPGIGSPGKKAPEDMSRGELRAQWATARRKRLGLKE